MMWRKHPLARLIIGLAVVLAALGTLGAALVFGADFWSDGRQPPRSLEGQVRSISSKQSPSAIPGHFVLATSSGETVEFELKNNLLLKLAAINTLNSDRPVTVTFSPTLRNVYTIQAGNATLVQDNYDPNQPFQNWQRIPVYMLAGILFIGLVALVYMVVALFDWLWPVQRLQGVLVARIERAEIRSDGFSIVVRPWNKLRPGKQAHFELSQADFLSTDGVDFIEVVYTRFFRYVRKIRPLAQEELPSSARETLAGLTAEGLRLSYSPGWRLRVFLYSDGFFALLLFVVTLVIILSYLPDWNNPQKMEPPQWLLMPLVAMLSFIMGGYLLLRFRRKLQDINAPKRVTNGPVLSKWRVTGTSNDNRRLIVVADGGLAAGETGVRKFDLSPALFDQLQVGDIVEIEHTPRLRYICRLEVKGHQELTGSYQV